ncbi:MAG: hypothetical protein JXL80_07450 [Planctomycetes bacterium]|nr:hypothetical protein [Planctomycetota bacterium]
MNTQAADFGRLERALRREDVGRPMAMMELHADDEIMTAIMGRPTSRRDVLSLLEFQKALGYDYMNVYSDLVLEFNRASVLGDAAGGLAGERSYIDEQQGPITTAAEFEAYPWPDPSATTCSNFAKARPRLADGMKMIARCHGPFEWGTWLMGIQQFCMALVTDRELVERVFARVSELIVEEVARMVRQDGVGAVWISDDLGFNQGTFVSPSDLRLLVFPTYREICRLAHERDLPVLLHSCGKLDTILGDLVGCGIEALHSLPPGLYDLGQLKAAWGDRLCLLGNIDVDLLTRGNQDDVRAAVRRVRDEVYPGGGIILSSSNSIANYCKVENYLAMVDEARRA